MYYEVCILSEDEHTHLFFKYCDTKDVFLDIKDDYVVLSIHLVDCNGYRINVTDLIYKLYNREFN